jgi:uncharacterized protein YceK
MDRTGKLALILIVLLTGCTTLRELSASDTEALLTQAGFTREPADATTLATARPYKIVTQTREGQARYLYLDPSCTCAWVGNSHDYAVYRQMAIERRVKAEEADDDAAAWAEK